MPTKTLFYTIIESQVLNNGSKTLLNNIYDNLNDALARYYTILSVAAVSLIPYHAAFIIRSDGIMIEGKVFDRREKEN